MHAVVLTLTAVLPRVCIGRFVDCMHTVMPSRAAELPTVCIVSMCSSLCILHRPAGALANAPFNGDGTAPLLRLVRIVPLVPQGHRDDCLVSALPDELLLRAGPVGCRCPDAQHLLDGLQHSALAAAILAGDKVDVRAAGMQQQDSGLLSATGNASCYQRCKGTDSETAVWQQALCIKAKANNMNLTMYMLIRARQTFFHKQMPQLT